MSKKVGRNPSHRTKTDHIPIKQGPDISYWDPAQQTNLRTSSNHIPLSINISRSDSHPTNCVVKTSEQHQQLQQTLINYMNKYDENVSLSEVFSYIQDAVPYQRLSEQQIIQQKLMLKVHIKILNAQLNKIIKQHIEKHECLARHKVRRRFSKSFDNELSEACMSKQVENNRGLLANMQKEYSFLRKRLQGLQAWDNQVQDNAKISNLKEQIRSIRLDAIQKKHKIAIQENKMSKKTNKHIQKQYFDLQHQYVMYSRQKQRYLALAQKLEDQKGKIMTQDERMASQYGRACGNAKEHNSLEKTKTQVQQYCVMYEISKRKLQLAIKRRQRNVQSLKKTYYELLKEYGRIGEQLQDRQEQIECVASKVDRSHQIYERYRKQIANLPLQSCSHSFATAEHHNGFMCTEIVENKYHLKQKQDDNVTSNCINESRQTTKMSNKYHIKMNRYKTQQNAVERSYQYRRPKNESGFPEISQLEFKAPPNEIACQGQNQYLRSAQLNSSKQLEQSTRLTRMWLVSQLSNKDVTKSHERKTQNASASQLKEPIDQPAKSNLSHNSTDALKWPHQPETHEAVGQQKPEDTHSQANESLNSKQQQNDYISDFESEII